MSRSFTVIKVTDTHGRVKSASQNAGGRYISKSPAGAASKAGSQICAKTRVKGQCSLIIVLKETTQGSAHKEFAYRYRRVHEPRTVMRGGVEITYQYTTRVKAFKGALKTIPKSAPRKSVRKSMKKSVKKMMKKSAKRKSKSKSKSRKRKSRS